MTVFSPKRAIVCGYATLDYIAATAAPLDGPGTVAARLRHTADWPRPGGAVFYTSARLAKAGHATACLSVLGDDRAGDAFITACHDHGVATDGIARVTGGQSPACLLIYHDSGDYSCLLDTGDAQLDQMTPVQLRLVQDADLVVISAGPAALTRAVLDAVAPHQRLAWIAKADAQCFPPDLCAALSTRADFIFHNASESHLLGPPPARQIRIETRGGDGAFITADGQTTALSAQAIPVADATGAGDTLAGECLAQWLSGERTPEVILRHGMAAAGALLAARVV